jgi:hypothetical protein
LKRARSWRTDLLMRSENPRCNLRIRPTVGI